jgi:hypothetical protein
MSTAMIAITTSNSINVKPRMDERRMGEPPRGKGWGCNDAINARWYESPNARCATTPMEFVFA